MKMKIKIFILLNVYLYTINNYSESSNDKSLYYFYQKLSKININKDTTLEKLLEEIKTATQQTAEEIDDVNLIKQKSEFIECLSKMLDDNQIKKISFGNIALFLERIGVEYQKNNELKNWKNNFFNIKKIAFKKAINSEYGKFYKKLESDRIKDNVTVSRVKNLFYGLKIATIAAEKDALEGILFDHITYQHVRLIGITLITLFRGINRARDSFDNNKNYTPRKGNDDFF